MLREASVKDLCSIISMFRSKLLIYTYLLTSTRRCFAGLRFVVFALEQKKLRFFSSLVRVAPRKALSIPKLELDAALLDSRLKDDLQKRLLIEAVNTFMSSYSTTLLQWFVSKEKLPIFVSNRVEETRL